MKSYSGVNFIEIDYLRSSRNPLFSVTVGHKTVQDRIQEDGLILERHLPFRLYRHV